MSLRDLVDGECGGANQLMRMGAQLTRDSALKDEGFAGSSTLPSGPRPGPSDEFVNEFLTQAGRTAPPPQSFRMDALLKEMQGISQQQQQQGGQNQNFEMWRNEFVNQQRDLFDGPSTSHAPRPQFHIPPPMVMAAAAGTTNWTREFFNEAQVLITISLSSFLL